MNDSVLMPQLGETVAEGKILTWFKSIGDEIKEGDNLFEVETDKVTIEVQATVAGRLTEIRVGSGSVAKVGEVVAVITGDAKAQAPVRSESTAPKKPEAWRSPFEEVSTPKDRFGPAKGPDGVRITPLARRLIAQNGADIGKLAAEVKARGSSRVDEQAVRAFLAGLAPPLPAQVFAFDPDPPLVQVHPDGEELAGAPGMPHGVSGDLGHDEHSIIGDRAASQMGSYRRAHRAHLVRPAVVGSLVVRGCGVRLGCGGWHR